MTSTRAFLALDVPDQVRARLDWQRRPLIEGMPRARWVRPEGQHLTLKFLGEVEGAVLTNLVHSLRRGLADRVAVRVVLGGGGFFPNSRRPKVAWVGGTADGVESIVEIVERCSQEHGFARDRRPWALHLTQARLSRVWPRWAVSRFLDWGDALTVDPFECTEVVLYSSEQQPGGAVYTAVERMTLG